MNFKEQIPSLSKFHSFYEEKPEEFLDETDIGCYSQINIFDISQSQQRIVQVSGGSNNKTFA